jgi:hypothetical protein
MWEEEGQRVKENVIRTGRKRKINRRGKEDKVEGEGVRR